MVLGDLIKFQRNKQDITLLELSRLSGLSQVYLSEIERGIKRPIKKESLEKISKGLNIPYSDIKDALIETIEIELEV